MITSPAATVAFRADASLEISTGHVMRCLTLADELRSRGCDCHFICREHRGHLLDVILRRGFAAHSLGPPSTMSPEVSASARPAHARWLGANWQVDADETLTILRRLKPDILVVDHYALELGWETVVRGNIPRLMVIDDLADRPHACDLLLDHNVGRQATDYAGLVPDDCEVLAGPRYALLRPEFASLRAHSLERRREPALRQLLITMGGVDQTDSTGAILAALPLAPLPAECRITVVLGSRAPALARVRQLAAGLRWPSEVRVDTNEMARLMADSDLAIGAAGGTALERCCLGLPSFTLVIAENQKPAAAALERLGAAVTLDWKLDLAPQLVNGIRGLVDDRDSLIRLSQNARDLTDGAGAGRVVSRLLACIAA